MSHQLRLLQAMGLVTGARRGRSVIYSLYDNHVALLLDEAVYHIEHLGLGITDETPAPGLTSASTWYRPPADGV